MGARPAIPLADLIIAWHSSGGPMSTTQLLGGSHLRTLQNSFDLMRRKSVSRKGCEFELNGDCKSTTMTSSKARVSVFSSVENIHLIVRLRCDSLRHPLSDAGLTGGKKMVWGIGFCQAMTNPKHKRAARGIPIRIQNDDMIRSPLVHHVPLKSCRGYPGRNAPSIARTTPQPDSASAGREKEVSANQLGINFLLGRKQFQEASTALAGNLSEAWRQSSCRIAVWVLGRNEAL
jgi:hypothetical protein